MRGLHDGWVAWAERLSTCADLGPYCHTPYYYLGVLGYGMYTFALVLGLGPCKPVWAVPADVLGWALISSPGGGGSDTRSTNPIPFLRILSVLPSLLSSSLIPSLLN
jgi:hypothetical protein